MKPLMIDRSDDGRTLTALITPEALTELLTMYVTRAAGETWPRPHTTATITMRDKNRWPLRDVFLQIEVSVTNPLPRRLALAQP
jgi:hypothetical protein